MHRSQIFCVNIGMIILIMIIYQPFLSIMAEPLRGHNMLPADVPFVASLARKLPDDIEERYHFCSGSLIAKKLVLTAAHCLEGKKYHQVDVVFGAADLRGARPKYEVQSWKTFEKWAAKKNPQIIRLSKNDIAIIKLKRQVKQAGVIPANITTLRDTELHDKNAAMIGWNADQDNPLISRFLKKARVQILPTAACERRYHLISNQLIRIPEGLLCSAADPFVITTEGDSGAPLLDDNNDILGITRSICPLDTFNCSEEFVDEHRFNLHTDFIDEYRQFIDDSKINF